MDVVSTKEAVNDYEKVFNVICIWSLFYKNFNFSISRIDLNPQTFQSFPIFSGLRFPLQVWRQRHLRSGHEVAGGRPRGRQPDLRTSGQTEVRREELRLFTSVK